MKVTHDSGGFVVCKDKSKLNKEAAKQRLEKSLKKNYFWGGREWPYKNVKPRILAEMYIDSLGKPSSTEYKLTCFDGYVKVITVCGGIAHAEYEKRSNDHFDWDWNKQEWWAYCKPSGKKIERPKEMDEIIEYAEKLSSGIPQVRVDFYVHNGNVFFGEMTFYTWSGFIEYNPPIWNEIMGSWLVLPEKRQSDR